MPDAVSLTRATSTRVAGQYAQRIARLAQPLGDAGHAGQDALDAALLGDGFRVVLPHRLDHLLQVGVDLVVGEPLAAEGQARDLAIQHAGQRHAVQCGRPVVDLLHGGDEGALMVAIARLQQGAIDVEQNQTAHVSSRAQLSCAWQ